MSRENVENVRRGIDAWNRGDLEAWLAGFAPKAELHTTSRFPDRGVYRGRAGLERYWAEIRGDIEEISLSISDLRPIGDRVVFAVTGRGRGKRSGVPIERPLWFVTTLRDGLAACVETYVDANEALEAAGVNENVEIVKDAYRTLNEGDLEAGVELAASDIEIEASGLMLDQGTYRGHDGLMAYQEDLRKVWGDSLRSHPQEFIEYEDRVVVMSRTIATGHTSGATVDALVAHVWTIRDGKVARFETFGSREDALRAAALEE